MVGFITVLVLGALLLDHFVFENLIEQKNALLADKDTANRKLSNALNVIKREKDARPRWTEMTKNGLPRDSSTAQSQIYNAAGSWAREAGLNPPPALKSDRNDKEKEFFKVPIRATGNGNMQQIARFLWHIQTANIPVRVSELTLSTRKEGTDDLSLTMTLATIYLPPEADAQKTTSASIAREVQP